MNNVWYELSVKIQGKELFLQSTESIQEVEIVTADLKKSGIEVIRREYTIENEAVKLVGVI